MTISLANATKGQKYYTQDGRIAVFIGRDKRLERPYIFRLGDQVITRHRNGRHCETCDGTVHPSIVRKKHD